MSVAYLKKLNTEQRRAVEHGVREKCTPLLMIAGAGFAHFIGARMRNMRR